MMIGKIVSRDGKLWVLYETSRYSEPKIDFLWWEIVQTKASPYGFERPAEGDKVRYNGIGTDEWVACHPETLRVTGTVWTRNKADKTETVSAPSPKVRAGIETRWHDGRWEKLLKKGWVPA